MKPKERLKNYPLHPSSRGYFGLALYKEMAKNDKVWLVLADLGYKMLDMHCEDFPDRVVDCGAAECGALGVCIGLALKGKIPFFFSMTPFVLYRGYEWIRNYIDHESIPVKLVGSGRDKDYKDDSFTHECEDAKYVLDGWSNIIQFWPNEKEEIEAMVHEMVINNKPSFISLRR